MHLGYDWLLDRHKLYLWQQFTNLFYPHLKDTTTLEPFYYELLATAAKRFSKQNPKRVIIESYIKLLEYEGRLHLEKRCYICLQELGDNIALMRGFLPAHKECIFASDLNAQKVFTLLKTKKSIDLEEDEVDYLFSIVQKGL